MVLPLTQMRKTEEAGLRTVGGAHWGNVEFETAVRCPVCRWTHGSGNQGRVLDCRYAFGSHRHTEVLSYVLGRKKLENIKENKRDSRTENPGTRQQFL